MNEAVSQFARFVGLAPGVAAVLLGLTAALTVGSAVRLIRLVAAPIAPEQRRKRLGSLAVWWVLLALLILVACLGALAAAILFTLISLIGLREFRGLARERIAPVWLWWRLAYVAVPIHYTLVALRWDEAVSAFIPVWVCVTLLVRLAIGGRITGFLETAGITFLGLMLIVFLFSHAVRLVTVHARSGVGLFVYLAVLTEGNDIAQALWGRMLGRHKITPTVSPNKTWEGFVLGAATTTAAALLLAGPLTPFTSLESLAAGLLIAVGGFLGDITMSSVKREVGVKDTGAILPGQGGILDRIDSLTFTGPLFFYFAQLVIEQGTP